MDQKVQQYHIPPPNYSLKEHATNGYSQRLSPAQVTSYIVILYTTIVYFTCIITIRQQTVLLVLLCIFLFTLIVSSALSTLLDPTDRVVYYYKWSRHDKKVTFSPQYDKVLFCQFCDSYCRSNSKHCRVCNRCVNKFDHHCMWFNNCVGERNYVFFFISIISTFSFSVVVVVHVIISSLAADYSEKREVIMMVLGWIAGLLMAIFGFLLFNLIALHVYLNINDLTTYQFLQIRKKEEEEERKNKERKDKVTIELEGSIRISNNKVMPEHHQIHSEESFANLQKVVVTKKQQLEAETQEIGTGRGKSKHNLQIEVEQEPRPLVFQDMTVKSESNKSNKDVEASEEVRSERESSRRKTSEDSLPNFFKENRSLRFLLPSSVQAQSPLKRRQNRIPTFQL